MNYLTEIKSSFPYFELGDFKVGKRKYTHFANKSFFAHPVKVWGRLPLYGKRWKITFHFLLKESDRDSSNLSLTAWSLSLSGPVVDPLSDGGPFKISKTCPARTLSDAGAELKWSWDQKVLYSRAFFNGMELFSPLEENGSLKCEFPQDYKQPWKL